MKFLEQCRRNTRLGCGLDLDLEYRCFLICQFMIRERALFYYLLDSRSYPFINVCMSQSIIQLFESKNDRWPF